MPVEVRRLQPGDESLAREAFLVLATAFDEAPVELPEAYLTRLLRRQEFWAIAAVLDGHAIGALTAHTLAMTRSATDELFVYDIAVATPHRRQGIGRALLGRLCEYAGASGIPLAFVLADGDDDDALDFYRALGAEESPVSLFVLPCP